MDKLDKIEAKVLKDTQDGRLEWFEDDSGYRTSFNYANTIGNTTTVGQINLRLERISSMSLDRRNFEFYINSVYCPIEDLGNFIQVIQDNIRLREIIKSEHLFDAILEW